MAHGGKERKVMSDPEDMREPGLDEGAQQKGFTLIEVLMVAIIIVILASMAVVSTRGAKRIAFETRAIAAMKNIGENEVLYYQRHGEYGYWEEMKREEDLVDPGYDKDDDLSNPRDTPIANLYTIFFLVPEHRQSFTAVAFPAERSIWHLRTYAVTCDGSILDSHNHGKFFSTLFKD